MQVMEMAVTQPVSDQITNGDACNQLCRNVHGFDRAGEVADARSKGTAAVIESDGRITDYTTEAYWDPRSEWWIQPAGDRRDRMTRYMARGSGLRDIKNL